MFSAQSGLKSVVTVPLVRVSGDTAAPETKPGRLPEPSNGKSEEHRQQMFSAQSGLKSVVTVWVHPGTPEAPLELPFRSCSVSSCRACFSSPTTDSLTNGWSMPTQIPKGTHLRCGFGSGPPYPRCGMVYRVLPRFVWRDSEVHGKLLPSTQ